MYRYLDLGSLSNGVISWLQTDLSDGDSLLDDIGGIGNGSNSLYRKMLKAEYDATMKTRELQGQIQRGHQVLNIIMKG